MNREEFLKRALEFKAKGFSIVPLVGWNSQKVDEKYRGKRPLVDWTPYQGRIASDKEIMSWAKLEDELNIGIACGKVSNITVVDIDGDEGMKSLSELNLPETYRVSTGKGIHYYFQYCPNPAVNNAVRILPGIDVRTEGGYVVSPFSKHRTGNIYTEIDPSAVVLPFPEHIIHIFEERAIENKKRASSPDYDVTKELVEGKRNKTLASIGGILRHSGVPADLVESFLLELNSRAADPDDEDVVRSVAHSVCRYENAPPSEKWTDYGLGSTFLRDNDDKIKFAQESGKWYFYNGKQWKGCFTQKGTFLNSEVMDLLVGFLTAQATIVPDEDENKEKYLKFLKEYESTAKMTQFLRGVAARVSASENEFDGNPYLFNCSNCAINLKTGEPMPQSKDMMLSKISSVVYDPAAQCPTWLSFLDRVFDNNAELIEYIQTALGYTMIGRIREKAVFLLVGEGDNGKSKFLDAIGHIFDVENDQYGTYANFSTFTTARDGEIRCDLAGLRGARYVFASEGRADAALDDTVIKSITGDDRIRARFLYQNEAVFRPTFKIWLATNKLPYIKSTEHAMRVRIKLINFNVIIPKEEQDQFLGDKLKSEASGILNWLLKGVKLYNENGLKDCDSVMHDTKEYLDSMDLYKQFYDETLDYKEGCGVEARILYDSYVAWIEKKKQKPVSETRFGSEFSSHMYKTHNIAIEKIPCRRDNGSRYYKYMNIKQIGSEY